MMSRFIQGFTIIIVFLFLESNTLIAFSQSCVDRTQIKRPPLTIKLEASLTEPLKLNLEKALSIANLQNLDISSARHSKDLSKWKLWENYSNYLPDIKAGLTDQRLDGTFLIGGVFPIMTLTSSVSVFTRFDYRFFEGGKGFFNTLAAKKLNKSSSENLSGIIKNTYLETTKVYYQLLKENAQLDTIAKSLEEAKAVLELNQKREKEGVGTKFDVLQAETLVAEEEQNYISQQARYRDSAINLARLLNIKQEVNIIPDNVDLTPRKLFNTDIPMSEILSIAKTNRNELKKAELEYFAQKNYIGSAYADFLPRANLYGQYGGNGRVFFNRTKISQVNPDAIALDDNGNPIISMVDKNRDISNVIPNGGKPYLVAVNDSLMASKFIGIQLDWDIGSGLGLTTTSKINQARYQAMLAKNNLDSVTQKVEQEVRSSFLKVQTTEKLMEVSIKRLKSAQEALRLAKLRLENGVGINTELLNAQKQYSSALTSNIGAVIDYNNSQAELIHSIGIISIDNLVKSTKTN